MMLFVTLFAMQVYAQNPQIQGPRDNTQVYSGVVYGPIDQNDTLWRIASRYKQDQRFSVYQTMQAIFDLNPQAFENGNFNTMVNGATLQLPSDRFIARMDPQQARAKADRDDKALGRRSAASEFAENTNTTAAVAKNLMPDIPLVNKEDLTKSQTQLQSQLNTLRYQQKQQFEQLKNQVAASISSVEGLLAENKKLNQQLLQIDKNNRKLTQTVETELQSQIDQQVDQMAQLIALFKAAEQRRIDEESQSIVQRLTTPTALIIIMSSITFLLIIGLAIFLLRRTATPPIAPASIDTEPVADIVDDELVIGEIKDNAEKQSDKDSDELLAALSDDNELDEDDILSDELADDDALNSLSDLDLEDDLDELDELENLEDDMLVPDLSRQNISDDDSESDLSLDDLGLDDDKDNGIDSGEIDFDSDLDESALDDEDETTEETTDVKALPNEATNKLASEDLAKSINEISDDDTPDGIDLDENGEIDENTLAQISNQIEQKDNSITKLADEILNDLDNVPSDSENLDDLLDADSLLTDQSATDEPNETADDIEEEDDSLSDMSDELLTELESQQDDADELDALLANIDDDEFGKELGLEDNGDDHAITDSLEKSLEEDENTELNDEVYSVDDEALDGDQVSDLADELLKELENDDETSEELEELLAEIDNIDSIDIEESSEELDEFHSESKNAKSKLVRDDFLEDIPSFTADIGLSKPVKKQASKPSKSSKSVIPEKFQKSSTENLESAKAEHIQHDVKPQKLAQTANADAKQEETKTTTPSETPEINEIDEIDEIDDTVDLAKKTTNLSKDGTKLNTVTDGIFDEDIVDEDVLSSLPGLDNWMDDDETQTLQDEIDGTAHKDSNSRASELDSDDTLKVSESEEAELIEGLDDVDFDDMLNDIEEQSDNEDQFELNKSSDELQNAGLDLEALMTDEQTLNIDDSFDDLDDEFVDVDDLLRESDALPARTDDDLGLDLGSSLEQLMPKSKRNQASSDGHSADESLINTDQASNLDLVQVYLDMEDYEAAKELLDEVMLEGNPEQQAEAKALLQSLADH